MNLKTLARKLWSEWIRPLALPLLAVGIIKSSFAGINYVPTGSMKPTILEGDVVFVNRLAYDLKVPFTTWHLAKWADPARGDIVVCFAPDDGVRLVKRVVGLPGDVLQLRNDCLFINGVAVAYSPLEAHVAGISELEPAERASALFAREQLGARWHTVMALPRIPAPRDFGPVRVPAGGRAQAGCDCGSRYSRRVKNRSKRGRSQWSRSPERKMPFASPTISARGMKPK